MPPAGMTIDSQTGLFRWQPTLANLGAARVGVRVEEVDGIADDEITFDIQVLANAPPAFASVPPTSAVVGAPYRYDGDAIDPDADPMVYSIESGPDGLILDSGTGIPHWTPGADDLGAHFVAVRVDDSHGVFDMPSFQITVHPSGTNLPPFITSLPPNDATPGCAMTYLLVLQR